MSDGFLPYNPLGGACVAGNHGECEWSPCYCACHTGRAGMQSPPAPGICPSCTSANIRKFPNGWYCERCADVAVALAEAEKGGPYCSGCDDFHAGKRCYS